MVVVIESLNYGGLGHEEEREGEGEGKNGRSNGLREIEAEDRKEL